MRVCSFGPAREPPHRHSSTGRSAHMSSRPSDSSVHELRAAMALTRRNPDDAIAVNGLLHLNEVARCPDVRGLSCG